MTIPRAHRAYSVPLLLAAAACATNPATGERELSLVSEGQEIQMGRESHPQITASMGVVDNAALQSYVAGIGQRLAAVSERPELPWTFTVIDDPTVNAFAVPGGYIYVTRGILSQFESEAELAGVLGHEIGHVTARHSVSQMSRQQLQQLGLGVGMIFSSTVRQFGDVLSAGVSLLNLKYSRGDETQSDELGVRYMVREGYDPDALRGVFQMLSRVSGNDGGRVPEWQSTHPDPGNRADHIREVIAATPQAAAATVVDREEYLNRLDGMVFGPNPREGYFKDGLFLHPEMRFRLTFPQGWRTINQKTVVAAVSPEQDAIISLQLAEGNDADAAMQAFRSQQGVEVGQVQRTRGDGGAGARAEFIATTEQGEIRGEIHYIAFNGNVFQVMGYTPSARWGNNGNAISSTLSSFGTVTDSRVLNVQPWRIDIVRIPSAMSLTTFNNRYPSVIPMERLALLNQRDNPGTVIPSGSLVKRVVGEPLP